MTKSKRLNTRITPELKEALQDHADFHERSESWVVEQALKRYLGMTPIRTIQKSED